MKRSTDSNRLKALKAQLRYIDSVLKANTEGITDDESLIQPKPGGNCLNWILGHVVATRNRTLELVGRPAVWKKEEAERYSRHSPPITGPGPTVIEVSRILADFDASQKSILNALDVLSDEDLETRVSWFGENVEKEIALAGLLFHEAYHVGQTGLMRRLAGKSGAIV